MDASWPNEALSCAAQFHGLYDDLLSFDAPASKAGSQQISREAIPVTVQQVQAAEMNRKRKLDLAEKESLELFLTQLGSEDAVGTSGGLVDLDAGLKRKGSDEKEAKMDTARNKACRERARRERLNDRCCFSPQSDIWISLPCSTAFAFPSAYTIFCRCSLCSTSLCAAASPSSPRLWTLARTLRLTRPALLLMPSASSHSSGPRTGSLNSSTSF